MKKIILSLCVFGLLTSTAYAACNGGTERNGFCVSNVHMNWWSAAAWCQSNGRSLATMYDACPNWDGNSGIRCGRSFVDAVDNSAWTSTALNSNQAFYVRLSDGVVGNNTRNDTNPALCK